MHSFAMGGLVFFWPEMFSTEAPHSVTARWGVFQCILTSVFAYSVVVEGVGERVLHHEYCSSAACAFFFAHMS